MSVQTSYSDARAIGIAGTLLSDPDQSMIVSRFNAEASAEITFGRAVKFGATDDAALLPSVETSKILGIVLHSDRYDNGPNGELGTTGLKVGTMMDVLRRGEVLVVCEDGCVPGDRLWVRAVAGGDPEFLGGLNNADDSTDMVDCTKQGVWMTTAAAGGLARLACDFINEPD